MLILENFVAVVGAVEFAVVEESEDALRNLIRLKLALAEWTGGGLEFPGLKAAIAHDAFTLATLFDVFDDEGADGAQVVLHDLAILGQGLFDDQLGEVFCLQRHLILLIDLVHYADRPC